MSRITEAVKIEVINAALLLVLFVVTLAIVIGAIIATKLVLGSLVYAIGVVFGAAAVFIVLFKSLIFEEEQQYGNGELDE